MEASTIINAKLKQQVYNADTWVSDVENRMDGDPDYSLGWLGSSLGTGTGSGIGMNSFGGDAYQGVVPQGYQMY